MRRIGVPEFLYRKPADIEPAQKEGVFAAGEDLQSTIESRGAR
jgi:hypothetical protein